MPLFPLQSPDTLCIQMLSCTIALHKSLSSYVQSCITYMQASVTCAATGPLRIRDVSKISGPEGGEVFSEQKGLNLFQNKVLSPVLALHKITSTDF